jgi:hypothetical protein
MARQLDLLVGEGSNRKPHQHDDADRAAFAQQRHAEDGAIADLLLCGLQPIFRIGQNVGDVDRFALEHGARDDAAPARGEWNAAGKIPVIGRSAISRDDAIILALLAMHGGETRTAAPPVRSRYRAIAAGRMPNG